MSLAGALDWAAALLADTAFPPLESLVCCQLDGSGDALEVSALWRLDPVGLGLLTSVALWLLVCGDPEAAETLLGYAVLLPSLGWLLRAADEPDARLVGAVELGLSVSLPGELPPLPLLVAGLLTPLDGVWLEAWALLPSLGWLLRAADESDARLLGAVELGLSVSLPGELP